MIDLKLCTDSKGEYTHILLNDKYELRRDGKVYDPRFKDKRLFDYPSFIDNDKIQNVLRALWVSQKVIDTIPYEEVEVGNKLVFTALNIGTLRYSTNKAYEVIKINKPEKLAHRHKCWIRDDRNRMCMVMRRGVNKFYFTK